MDDKPKLFPCPVCNEPVSSDAHSCPHCGHPIAASVRKERLSEKTNEVKLRATRLLNNLLTAISIAIRFLLKLAAFVVVLFLIAGIGSRIFGQLFFMSATFDIAPPFIAVAFCAISPVFLFLPAFILSKKLFGRTFCFLLGKVLIIISGFGMILIAEPLRTEFVKAILQDNGDHLSGNSILVSYVFCTVSLAFWIIILLKLTKSKGVVLPSYWMKSARKLVHCIRMFGMILLFILSLYFGVQVLRISFCLLSNSNSFFRGESTPMESMINPKTAIRKKVLVGDVKATLDLAVLLSKDNDVTQHYEEAAHWFRAAAEMGNADAQYNLACCLIEGRGTQIDFKEGRKWMEIAASNGQVQAQSVIDHIAYIEPHTYGFSRTRNPHLKYSNYSPAAYALISSALVASGIESDTLAVEIRILSSGSSLSRINPGTLMQWQKFYTTFNTLN